MTITGITNCFLLIMEAYFTGGNSFLALQTWPKPMAGEVIGPSEEVAAIVLLNEPKWLFITIDQLDQCCFQL